MAAARRGPSARGPGSGGRADGDEPQRKGFLLRLPPRLLAELRAWASQEVRSLNGHIEYLLRDALRRRRREPPDEG